MEIIVPDGAKADISETETDVKVLIKREEIKALINRVILIAPALKQDETDGREMSDKLIELIVVNKNKVFGSLILDATIINFVVNGNVLDGTTIEIPTSLKENAKKRILQNIILTAVGAEITANSLSLSMLSTFSSGSAQPWPTVRNLPCKKFLSI